MTPRQRRAYLRRWARWQRRYGKWWSVYLACCRSGIDIYTRQFCYESCMSAVGKRPTRGERR